MAVNKDQYRSIIDELGNKATLVAVSKMRTVEEIKALYDLGQRDFGENYVQELVEKQLLLPGDIRWHYIGHLQTNKVKYIAPFVHLIHGMDSFKLLKEINKQGQKLNKPIRCLLQVHIAREETKFGLSEDELEELVQGLSAPEAMKEYGFVKICGLMGMATFTDDLEKVRREFMYLQTLFDKYSQIKLDHFHFTKLSMGMSDDYKVAIESGSNLVRIGSLLFGRRPGINISATEFTE